MDSRYLAFFDELSSIEKTAFWKKPLMAGLAGKAVKPAVQGVQKAVPAAKNVVNKGALAYSKNPGAWDTAVDLAGNLFK